MPGLFRDQVQGSFQIGLVQCRWGLEGHAGAWRGPARGLEEMGARCIIAYDISAILVAEIIAARGAAAGCIRTLSSKEWQCMGAHAASPEERTAAIGLR